MRRLLYIAPVIPSLTGNGLAMRAGAVLEALTACYRVSVLVAPIYPAFDSEISPSLRALCEDYAVDSGDIWQGQHFDVVHVFRLVSLAAARYWLSGEGAVAQRHLDLDDLESKTRRRMAALCRANGDTELALQEEAAARRSEMLEIAAYRRFHRVYVCSEADREALRPRCPAELVVLPNGVRAPESPLQPAATAVFRFLFLGTLGYYPNADAVRQLCQRIVPLMRAESSEPFEVAVAGSGVIPGLQELAASAGVDFLGRVPDVAALYAQAGAVLAPIQAGGGTRIKILEAFSRHCPVVTTSIGVEGIAARHEEHVLIADTHEEFATACLRLMQDRALAERLAQAAWQLWQQEYTIEAMRKQVSSPGLPPPPPES